MDIFLALIAHIGWGVGDIFVVKTARRMGTWSTTLWSGICALLIAGIFLLPFFRQDFLRLTPELFSLLFLLNILLFISHAAFIESFRVGNPTVVGVIAASFLAVSVILSILFLGEQLTREKGVVITLIMAGVLLCLLDKERFSFSWGRGEVMALIAMFGWGIYYAFVKIPIQSVGWFVPNFLFLALFPLVWCVFSVHRLPLKSPFSKKIFGIFIANVLFVTCAEWAYTIAIQASDVSLIVPIAGSYPALFVALSSIIFREPLHRSQWFGVVLTVIGICILAVVSS